MGIHRLYHRPPEPGGALLCDVAVAGDTTAAVGGRDDARIRAELIAGPKPVYVADLGPARALSTDSRPKLLNHSTPFPVNSPFSSGDLTPS
jgi:hypothetical protein